jgi:hypothetical protein
METLSPLFIFVIQFDRGNWQFWLGKAKRAFAVPSVKRTERKGAMETNQFRY